MRTVNKWTCATNNGRTSDSRMSLKLRTECRESEARPKAGIRAAKEERTNPERTPR